MKLRSLTKITSGKKKNPFINSSSNNLILNIKGHKIKN